MDGMEVARQISLEKLTNGLFVRGEASVLVGSGMA